ncbi:MAG: BON domain-containing protein [Tatlockia sp.]|nr:BON domain-containing protein [Tatlockia sp.]
MKKQGLFHSIKLVCSLILSSSLLTGCLANIWTGANLVYDRHNIYKKISDFQLSANASQALYQDDRLRCEDCSIDLAIFNGDILLAGHVPTNELRQEAKERVAALTGYRRLFNQIDISSLPKNNVEDSWITAKIRASIVANSEIDPHVFKVITSDRIVYLMGDVRPKQAAKVIDIARNSAKVLRVVKLLKYYHLSNQASVDN